MALMNYASVQTGVWIILTFCFVAAPRLAQRWDGQKLAFRPFRPWLSNFHLYHPFTEFPRGVGKIRLELLDQAQIKILFQKLCKWTHEKTNPQKSAKTQDMKFGAVFSSLPIDEGHSLSHLYATALLVAQLAIMAKYATRAHRRLFVRDVAHGVE